mmetsp:Transcript_11061/g.26844  ORF Transcript_11061/g.26844 Transcript_11061/m.26844 type:complete len:1113 (+) Transcript_11061:185-3523(+)
MANYKVTAKELSNLMRLTFDNTTGEDVVAEVLPVYAKKLGGVEGILKALAVDKHKGINQNDFVDRKNLFGENKVEQDPQEPLWKLMWEALQDPTLIFLTCAALISLAIGVLVEQKPLGWLEGVAILFAVAVVVTVGAVNDYQKEKQFRDLNAKKDDVTVTVLRDGESSRMSTHDLVVGDIVLLSTGDVVPADGAVLGRNDLAINEKMLTGETVMKKKSSEYVMSSGSVDSSPILFQGTFVQEGEGRLVVLAVGANTYQGSMEEKMKEAEPGRSILQKKLDAMTDLITTVSMYVSIALVVILLLRMAYAFYSQKCCFEAWDHKLHWSEMLGFMITGITIFVVAVPEGLPLAVTIALAFSVKKMLKDQNLVRHLSACETMGGATTICSDKTGTLTTSRMTVVKIWIAGQAHNSAAEVLKAVPKVKTQLAEASVINTLFKTFLKIEKGITAYCGNDTECALLLLADELGDGYNAIRKRRPDDEAGRRCISFSSDRKRMSTVVPAPDGSSIVYTKGAAEIVADLCVEMVNADGTSVPIDAAMRRTVEGAISDFADAGLRTLCLARRAVSAKDGANLSPVELETGLTLVCLVGIEDPLRKEVPQAIKDCQRAGIVVRMVTGDNLQTARAIARKCGIVTPDDPPGAVMDGKTFRDLVQDENGELKQDAIDRIWPQLRVLARSTPLDKHLLVSGIQASMITGVAQTVAVTGDGTNDAPALKKADVGFSMGIQGTDVAKNASDVIIMDDNFVSIVCAVKWGRCVYDNICKFLQFQLTVNITACALACVGAAILTESPLNAIQMLWVNLIMDSFASLALATEDPNRVPGLKEQLLDRHPYPRTAPLLSKVMVRNMIFHALWQLGILLFLIFAIGDVCESGESINLCAGVPYPGGDFFTSIRSGRPVDFDLGLLEGVNTCVPKFDPANTHSFFLINSPAAMPIDASGLSYTGYVPLRSKEYCQEVHGCGVKSQHYTIVFNVFVFLQVFNEVNARKIHNELNMFQGIMYNNMFLIVLFGTIIVQILLVQIPGLNTAFGCTDLDVYQWLVCIGLGFTSIPINFLIHFLPYEWISLGSWAGGLDEAAIDEVLETTEEADKTDVEMTAQPQPTMVHVRNPDGTEAS